MGICGPTGSLACALISGFGAVFMAAMAFMLSHDYPYLGEWYDKTSELSYTAQRDKATHGALLISLVYAALAVVCGLIFSYHSFRAPGYHKM